MAKKIFVNLPVKNLDKTKEFFSKLGFKFNPQFTDENAACMIIGENIYSMLITEKFFKSFIPGREISDAKKDTEVLNAILLNSKNEVDELVEKAVNAGGKTYREIFDYGWMYGKAFTDLDDHIWEIFYMNEKEMPKEMKDKGK